MKKISLLLLCITLALVNVNHLLAQGNTDPNEPRYLLDLNKTKITGFGNTHGELTLIDGKPAYNSGISGAFLFDYKYFFGIYSLSLQSRHLRGDIYPNDHDPISNPRTPSYVSNRICFNHGGLMVGYIHNPNNLWHLSTNLKLGTGRISLVDKDIEFTGMNNHHADWVGIITPEIDLELNLARWCKMGLSLGYRMVFAVDDENYVNAQGDSQRLFKSSQFSSPTAAIKFHFGSFGPRPNGKNGVSARKF